jgi:hypothetical protein
LNQHTREIDMEHRLLTSTLDAARGAELEQVLFYNRNQHRISPGAMLAVERYGTPRISLRDGRLWVTFDSGVEAQSLFVLEGPDAESRLVAAIVYTREADTLAVLFLAVHEDYAQNGAGQAERLFPSLLEELLRIAHHVKGIAKIKLYLTDPPAVISVGKQRPRHVAVEDVAAHRRADL